MPNQNPSFLSSRVKKSPQTGIRSDRYEFLGLDQAEPDLGDPLIGPSSVGANPYTGNISDLYVVASAGSGERYWTKQTSLIAGGVVTPGSITVRDEGAIVGGANQITDINFVGSGVTIRNPASWVGAGSSSVDVEITVTDVAVSGLTGAIPYKASNGFLLGADELYYQPGNDYVGIGTSIPTVRLDVRGDVNISGATTTGILTATSGAFLDSLTVGNFQISDTTTFFRIVSGNVGVGTTLPQSVFDVLGNSNFNGISTFTNIVVEDTVAGIITATTTDIGFATITNAFVGVLTATNATIETLDNTNGNITNLYVSAGSTLVGNLQVDTDTFYVNADTGNIGIGTTNALQRFQSGIGTNATVITDEAAVGIGTTNPEYNLDVRGDISLTGKIFANNTSGTSGQVLLSGGTDPVAWGAPGSVTVGSANSVGIGTTDLNAIFYPTFTQQIENNALLKVDTDGIAYNPAENRLGIGSTNPQSTLAVGGTITELYNGTYWNIVSQADIGIGASQVPINQFLGRLAFLDEYLPPQFRNTEVTTTATTANQSLSSFDVNFIRSAKYNVQVTCNGQLVGSASSSSDRSVSNLQGGTQYAAGSYTNVGLTAVSGSGNDARADIQVTPEHSITIDSISNGSFNSSQDTSGITTNSPVLFNRAIPATAAQNSKVTLIEVTGIGSGYTSVPTVTIDDPTNNPAIPGVTGIGSTATAVVSTLQVTDVTINTSGIHTVTPTVQFNTPVGSGNTATGVVGFGVSTVYISSSGSEYNPLPSVSISGGYSINAATVAISTVFVTNIEFKNTGIGYSSTNYPILTFSSPDVGIDTATAAVDTLGISTLFTSTPGIGYTRPPILTVDTPDVGINTANIECTLGIVTITVTNPGTGYTSSPILATTPTVTGFAATVGLGVTSDDIIVNGGSGYVGSPIVTFDSPDIGSDTAAGQFNGIGAGGALEDFVITNTGSGYFNIPSVSISGGGGSGAGVTVTKMSVTDVTINNIGFGASFVPVTQIVSAVGSGATVVASMGISRVTVTGFGTGYNDAPGVAVTAVDGETGSGGAVTAGLGITFTNVTITNPGTGYSSIPTVEVSSPVGVASTAIGEVGVGITGLEITNAGAGYSTIIPTIGFSTQSQQPGSGVAAATSTIYVTNVYITNPGAGYTVTDLASTPIATFDPVGTAATVGFGVSEISLTSLGIGYTTAASAGVTISAPELATGSTATATASLGYPGILPGPGVNTTGDTAIYYVASVAANSIGISTGVGIGTLTRTEVGDDLFLSNNPVVSVGGSITSVRVVSPGSGYTSLSQISALNFDGANVGTGFTFTSSVVVDNYQFSDVMVLQSVGSAYTSCDFIEFGTIANKEILGNFSADIDGTNARLLFTPTYRNNTIKISSNSISI